jgi:hypothetical protein
MAAIAVIHILDAVGTFSGKRYIFWLYMAVVAGAIPASSLDTLGLASLFVEVSVLSLSLVRLGVGRGLFARLERR